MTGVNDGDAAAVRRVTGSMPNRPPVSATSGGVAASDERGVGRAVD